VNEEAAVEELRAFQADLRTMLELERVLPHDYFKAPAWIEPNERVRQRMTLVLAIAEASEIPEAQENIRNGVDSGWGYSRAIDTCEEIIGHLLGEARRQAILGPQGPKLAAATMHRWVWDSASELWSNGHPREAVQAAATFLFDVQLPAKLAAPPGNPRELVNQAFSCEPPQPGKPRLRIPGFVEGTPAFNDVHDGAKLLGLACIAGIRNLSSGAHPVELDTD
jgi:RimJ/RimL family protein N-acetyltransferase